MEPLLRLQVQLQVLIGRGQQRADEASRAVLQDGCRLGDCYSARTMQSLWCEHQIARRKLPSTGGRPLYAYTEKDFSYPPPPTPLIGNNSANRL